jgi:branched-chain amino acid transport system ATP-binding protein
MNEAPFLQVENLSHRFGKFQVLSRISLHISRGALSALIGPNGAGKTTFYNVISGRFPPTAGKVLFKGRDITGMPAHKVAPLGLLRSFQITNIFSNLSVLENVLVPLTLHNSKGFSVLGSMSKQRSLYEKAEGILHKLGILDQAHRPAHELAYGDKRLVEIAIVMAREPELILLDEPTAGMTPEETERMTHLIKELADHSGITFFLTEHDMKVVFAIADYIYVLHQGSLLVQGTPELIRSNQAVKEAYLGGSLDA